MKFNSIRFKISILYTGVLGIILVIYSAFMYLSLHYVLYDELDNELVMKAQEIDNTVDAYLDTLGNSQQNFIFALKRVVRLEGEHPLQERMLGYEKQWLQKVDKFDLKEDFINITDFKGQTLVNSANFDQVLSRYFLSAMKSMENKEVAFWNAKFEKRNLRIISVPFSNGSNRYIIQIGTSVKPIIHLLKIRLVSFAISIPIILLLASFMGRLFAKRILQPVVEVTRTAKNITHEKLTARVEAKHIDEEMKYLVDAFNEMISRLEKSFQYIAEFSSHVAHELKTPLAIVRGESELTLRKERPAEEYKRALAVNLEESERMLKTIDDLLLLTKLDYRPEAFKFERFDLIDFLKEICEQGRVLAFEKKITINIDLPQNKINIKGDRLHLRRLLFNLIDNAIKFTPERGKIDISAKAHNKRVSISILDTGPGIPREDIQKIFRRFYRVDNASHVKEPGSGLGLSIAKSIAELHFGDIQVKSELSKGSTFTILLPLA